MKKISLLLLAMVAVSLSASAQYWMLPSINAGQNPGNLNNYLEEPSTAAAPWTTLLSTSATPAWSTTQTIPFTFTFNGNVETSYKVSSTGVLTFDVATALAAPSATNAALPDANIPDKSICVWGINASGANDKVITTVLGTAPNRQLWISYNSCTNVASATSFCYWSIVLEETTNKIHIVDQRTSSGSGAITIAISAGLQFTSSNAMAIPGSPALNSTTSATAGGNDTPSDNSYYTYTPGVQPADDVALMDVTPHDGAPTSFVVAPGNVPLSFKVKNLGSSTITGLTLTYNDGSGPVNDVKSGLSIISGATQTLTVATPVAVATAIHKSIACSVTLTNDADLTNNTFATGVTGAAFQPVHHVVFEEATGTWCGWCVRGMVYMDSMRKVHPDAVRIAVHNNDPMTVSVYDNGIGNFISGYPSVVIDRKETDDPSNMFGQYTKHNPDFGFADIAITNTLTGSSLSSKVDCHFAVDLTGSYRLAMVITEDDVHGTTTAWDQHNYYSSQTNNLPLSGYGHNFQQEPDPVPAANIMYDDVAVAIDNSFTGRSGTITSPITAGSNQSYTFTYSIPATSTATKMYAKALLIDQNSGIIMNAAEKIVSVENAVAPISSNTISADVYPNPATTELNVAIALTATQEVKVEVVNLVGQTLSIASQTIKNGVMKLDIASLPAGNYFVKITTANETITKKVTKQ